MIDAIDSHPRSKSKIILERAQRDPLWFFDKVLGAKPWKVQAEIVEAVRDERRVTVRSCHGAGKSWLAARIAIWFLYSFHRSIVVTTAPTFRQVKEILWQEIRDAHTRALMPLGGIVNTTDLRIAEKWFAFGFATDQPQSAQGIHAEHVLAIIDEAGGVDPATWAAVDGWLVSDHARVLSIGNPIEPSGPFYDEHVKPGAKKFRISAFDTPNVIEGREIIPGLVTRAWVEEKKSKWGESSPLYVSKVLGDFPQAGVDTLIPLSLIEAAQARTLEPFEPNELAVDVARFGDDETVLLHRRGPVARIVSVTSKQDTMQTSGAIVAAMRETQAERVKIDGVGVGAGVVDRVREQKVEVVEMSAGSKSSDPERFPNKRAEWFWGLRERFESGEADIDPNDDELASQLASLRYKLDSRGRVVIESKDDMKARGLPSPDRADALAMGFGKGVDIETAHLIPSLDIDPEAGARESSWKI